MPETLILQSHTQPLPYSWLNDCLASVRQWAHSQSYDYRFIDDELFEVLPVDLAFLHGTYPVIASDIARLTWLSKFLQQGYQRVIWMDADFLIFDQAFSLSDDDVCFGREVWIQPDKKTGLKVYKKIHNAFLQFSQGNAFLDFYIHSATQIVRRFTGHMPAQLVGPKLLSAFHNIVSFPVNETAAVLSPVLIQGLLNDDDEVIKTWKKHSQVSPHAVNLCASSCVRGELSEADMQRVIALLTSNMMGDRL